MSDKLQIQPASATGTVAAPAAEERHQHQLHHDAPPAAPRSPAARESGGYIAEKVWLVVDFLKSSFGRRARRSSSGTTSGGTASPVFVDTRQSAAAPTGSEQANQAALPDAPTALGVWQRDQLSALPMTATTATAAAKGSSHTPIALQAAHAVEKAVKDAADFSGSAAVNTMHEEMEGDKVRHWADVVHTGGVDR